MIRCILRAVLGMALCIASPAAGQTGCRPTDSLGMVFLAHITRYAASTAAPEAAVRDSLRLRPVSPEQIRLVLESRTCSQAAMAYRHDLSVGADTHTGRVYVVQAGDRYAVLDPAYHIAPRRPTLHGVNWTIVIYDATWQQLSLF
jgi:hypothetical protein